MEYATPGWRRLVPNIATGLTLLLGLGAIEAARFGDFDLGVRFVLLAILSDGLDGMLAREFGQQSVIGIYLNELGDALSDIALYAPFALVSPFSALSVGAVIVGSLLVELAGTIGAFVSGEKRHEGPMGKSDRAAVFGVVGLWVGVSQTLPQWGLLLMPILVGLLGVTLMNRVRVAVHSARVELTRPHSARRRILGIGDLR